MDLVFKITGQALPIDHAYALFQGLVYLLPWIQDDQWLGIHHVHIAESGNGWIRSDDHGILQLSGRARLVVRLHINMLDSARLLCGKQIAVDKYMIEIGPARVRPLNPLNTVSARHVVADQEIQNETKFLQWVNTRLNCLGITPTKLLCGKTRLIHTPTRTLRTRSLMIADLKPGESLSIQQFGMGVGRKLGCGL
ncbi:MAG: type I-MYXAN CRISPR-associated protein Cas6/Cmx6, partial [Pseudomonadota bacterium]|nr:type I-MYXAN CRISPR-associated protein Cas6/Cmx6 [Pseudomonadota bacterium]